MAKVNKEELEKRVEDGLVFKRKHPTLGLWIYNYTPECQFSRAWDDITIMCRGLVLDSEYNIIARPFKKFFNYTEAPHQDLLYKVINDRVPFSIQEKVDGSLIIAFYYKGQLVVATRGSFESEQAAKATELIKKLNFLPEMIPIYSIYTFLFEVIFKANRIVIDYQGAEELVLLSIIHTETGREFTIKDIKLMASLLGCRCAKTYEYESIDGVLNDLNGPKFEGTEGVVIRWEMGNNLPPFRVKLKTESYTLLHKIVTGINEKRVWEALKNGKETELDSMMPDELYDWYFGVKTKLIKGFYDIINNAQDDLDRITNLMLPTRKENALEILKCKHSNVIFMLLDKKDPIELVWDILEPKYVPILGYNLLNDNGHDINTGDIDTEIFNKLKGEKIS